VRTRKPGRLLFGIASAAVVCLAWATAASASGGAITLPAIQGPAISAVTGGSRAATTPCPFVALGYACRSVYELQQAYNFPRKLDGTGQTIMIVDAYGSPTIQSDLTSFDTYYGIPAPRSFEVRNAPPARGSQGGSGALQSWQLETSLDVEYAHAMAPGARIVLVVAASDNNDDINAAELWAFLQYRGVIVSQSFGDWETDPTAGNSFQQEHRIFELGTALGDTILASAGDAGATWTQYTGTTTPAIAAYPASDPLVTAVGGTEGLPYPDGLYNPVTNGYGGEQVWNEKQFDAATGGAPSRLFPTPFYQFGLTGYSKRTIPDVSYNAAVLGGVAVWSSPYIYLVGGTSAGSPQWAAIFALADQARGMAGQRQLGLANPALYAVGRDPRTASRDFHDITVGNNRLDSPVGFDAKPGYDLASGLGTPNVSNLIGDLTSAPFGEDMGFAWHGDFGGPDFSGDGRHTPHTMSPGQ
jgi:subtilase family serine protease